MYIFERNKNRKVLRTLIIDDEAHIRESLAAMLKSHCHEARLVAQADGVKR